MSADSQRVAQFIAVHSAEDRLRTVCEWTLKCYTKGKTVAVHLADPEDADRLDGKMWTFKDMAFLPHVRASQAQEPILEPVIIYESGQDVKKADVLFEVGGEDVLPGFERFPYIFDLAVVYDEACRQNSRTRYSAYQDAGYEMRYIDR
ncbi:MAG: DNA polymerase III subunit chi [Planctomycetota bacterium]